VVDVEVDDARMPFHHDEIEVREPVPRQVEPSRGDE
jgi:hypothetical protein